MKKILFLTSVLLLSIISSAKPRYLTEVRNVDSGFVISVDKEYWRFKDVNFEMFISLNSVVL